MEKLGLDLDIGVFGPTGGDRGLPPGTYWLRKTDRSARGPGRVVAAEWDGRCWWLPGCAEPRRAAEPHYAVVRRIKEPDAAALPPDPHCAAGRALEAGLDTGLGAQD